MNKLRCTACRKELKASDVDKLKVGVVFTMPLYCKECKEEMVK